MSFSSTHDAMAWPSTSSVTFATSRPPRLALDVRARAARGGQCFLTTARSHSPAARSSAQLPYESEARAPRRRPPRPRTWPARPAPRRRAGAPPGWRTASCTSRRRGQSSSPWRRRRDVLGLADRDLLRERHHLVDAHAPHVNAHCSFTSAMAQRGPCTGTTSMEQQSQSPDVGCWTAGTWAPAPGRTHAAACSSASSEVHSISDAMPDATQSAINSMRHKDGRPLLRHRYSSAGSACGTRRSHGGRED